MNWYSVRYTVIDIEASSPEEAAVMAVSGMLKYEHFPMTLEVVKTYPGELDTSFVEIRRQDVLSEE